MTAMPPRTHSLEFAGGTATIVLGRPEVRNAFNAEMIAELTESFRRVAASDARALVLTGGDVFCAGADIGWMREAAGRDRTGNLDDARRLADMFRALCAVPCPTIAAVAGAALGGGAGLVAAADLAVAEEGTKFGFTEVRLGIVPAVISAVVVPAIGVRNARGLFATGTIFDAAAAARIGLVFEVVPKGTSFDRARALAADAASAAPAASRRAKRLADRVASFDGDALFDMLAEEIADVRSLPEARDGLAAFLEKRSPPWKVTDA